MEAGLARLVRQPGKRDEYLLPDLAYWAVSRRISSPRTKLLAARCDCMHEHFHPITMLNS
jgi:hypothetical protein